MDILQQRIRTKRLMTEAHDLYYAFVILTEFPPTDERHKMMIPQARRQLARMKKTLKSVETDFPPFD